MKGSRRDPAFLARGMTGLPLCEIRTVININSFNFLLFSGDAERSAAIPAAGFARTARGASGYFDCIFCAGKLLVPYRVTRPVTLP